MKNKILIALFAAIGIFFIIISCTSCKAIKKVTASSHVDSNVNILNDSSKLFKKDSAASQTKDSTGTSVNKKKDKIHIEFDNTDSSKYKSPVRITDSGNTIIIDAGGRKLKSIDKDSESEKKDSSGIKTSADTHVNNFDSSSINKRKNIAVVKTTQTKLVDKKLSIGQILSLVSLMLALIGLVIIVWEKYGSKIVSFIKTFI